MYTWTLSAFWSCWFYREGPLVKHGDCLYNNIATVTSNRCLECVSFAAVKFIIVLSIAEVMLGMCMLQCVFFYTRYRHDMVSEIIIESEVQPDFPPTQKWKKIMLIIEFRQSKWLFYYNICRMWFCMVWLKYAQLSIKKKNPTVYQNLHINLRISFSIQCPFMCMFPMPYALIHSHAV